MYCKNCGKELITDARFCMYCGTPVDVIPTKTITDAVEAPAPETVQATRPAAKSNPAAYFADEAKEEPMTAERVKPVFDEINWNVSEYPDNNEEIQKTDDIDFNWNANPADIPDPVARRQQMYDTQATAEPVTGHMSDVDSRLENVIQGSDLESELFGGAADPEELSPAERIDKFYTFNKKNAEFQSLLNQEYGKVKSGNAIGAEMSRADELAQERFDARANSRPATMDDFLEAEGIVKPYQPKAFESDVLQRIEAQEAARAAQKAEEEARRAAMEQARQEAEAARIKAEEEAEAQRKASEEYRIQQEADARIAAERARAQAEAEARQAARAAEEARAQAAEEAKARAAEEARRAAAEAKIREEEEARRIAEEEARIKAQAVARYQAQEEARIKAEEELKAAQQAAKIKAQQEARLAAEEAAKFEAAKKKRAMEAAEAKNRLEQEQTRLTRQANNTIANEEARKVLEQTARMRDEEAAKIRAAVAGLRASARGEAPTVSRETQAAHQATRNQINDMARARDTFFGELDLKKELEQRERAAQAQHTGRETMLSSGSNLKNTRVVDKAAVMAGIADETIAASRDQFSDLNAQPARPIDFKEPAQADSVDDLLNQLETVDETYDDYDFEPLAAEPVNAVEDLPAAEPVDTYDDFDTIDDFAELDAIGGNTQATAEPTMVFGADDASVFSRSANMSGTREFDFNEPAQQVTGDTIVIGQAPQSFADLPSNDFDDYGNAEAAEYARTQQEDAFGTFPQQAAPAAAAAVAQAPAQQAAEYYDEPAPLSKKEQKAAAKEAKAAEKAAAKAAKKEAKAARKAGKKAPVEEDYDEAPAKGGAGRTILIILLILLCMILAAEVVGIGVHYVAPESKIAEIVDTQLNKVIHMITGDDTDYSVFAETRREGPLEDYSSVVTAQADKNYNGDIEKIVWNSDLKYDSSNKNVKESSDLVLSTPIAEVEWGRDDDNNSVYYDEAVIGQAIAYESQKYELMKSGDEKVLDMISRHSMKYTLKKKANSNPGEFKELEIGEIRVQGEYFYIWIREHIGNDTNTRVLKMHAEKQFVMMMDRGYDI